MIVQGLPEIESAIAALTALANGKTLTDDETRALGQAMVAAHNRVQALQPAPPA